MLRRPLPAALPDAANTAHHHGFYQPDSQRAIAPRTSVRYLFPAPDCRWTYTVPPELRPRLEAVLSYRSVGASEVSAEVRDWLAEHEVPVPDGAKLEPEADAPPPRFLTTPSPE